MSTNPATLSPSALKEKIDELITDNVKIGDEEVNKLKQFIMDDFTRFLDNTDAKDEIKKDNAVLNYAFKRFIDSQIELLDKVGRLYMGYRNRGIK